MVRKISAALVFLVGVMGFGSPAFGEWHYGIGTGMFFLHVEGESGFNTRLAGPVKVDIDLDPEDFSDLAETAFGLGGYAGDGTWLIKYSLGVLKLEDKTRTTLQSGATLSSKLNYDIYGGEVLVGYPLFSNRKITLRGEAGVRYTRHDIDLDLSLGSVQRDRSIDESWTDALLGLSLAVPFAEKWSWDSQVNAGFGGSEGTYSAQSSISRQIWKHLSTSVYGKYTAVDYENGSRGDSDWFLYDADEYGLGFNVLFSW